MPRVPRPHIVSDPAPVSYRRMLTIALGTMLGMGPGMAAGNDNTPSATPATTPTRGTAARAPAAPTERMTVTSRHVVGTQPGGGLIRTEDAAKSVSTIGTDFMRKQAPSATAFDMVSLLPGANVSSSDALGFSPQTNITVRGLGGDSLGYVLEGMPLNDIAYYNGYPGQFADTENYQSVSLAQGTADLDSPVLNAAGGLMSMSLRDPSMRAGGYADVSYGSYNTNRQFLRLDTGQIGHTGIRGFVSYSHGYTDNWRGPGHDERQHIDFKFLREWGAGNRVSVLGTWNTMVASYYPPVDKADWQAQGPHGAANNLAATYNPNDAAGGTDYWQLYRQPERIAYIAAPARFTLADSVLLKVTPYAQWSYGNAPSGTTMGESGLCDGTGGCDENAVVRANWTQTSYRSGFNAALDWQLGNHDLVVGYWYDYSDDSEHQPFTAVNAQGYAADIWVDRISRTLLQPDGQQVDAGSYHMISQTNALYAGDRMHFLGHRLMVDVGFREVMLDRHGTTTSDGVQTTAGSNSATPLPRIAIRYRISPRHMVFFNTTTNFRTPDETALFGGVTDTGVATQLKNEYSVSEELGYRYSGNLVVGSLTLFNYDFTNREIQTQIGQVDSTINGGGQTSRGVDVEIGLKPWHHFAPYLSGEYLHATIDSDIPSAGGMLATRGRTAVESPTLQASAGLSYDDGHIFGMASIHYTGRQYSTFMNDERMPDHTTGNLAIGYRMDDHAVFSHPEFRMNFNNITNQHYLSGVATPTLTKVDGPQYYVGGGLAVLFTASTGF
ncbi:TonB-dependent receptor [Komagataeibacter xylinus NBRC 13693]|uniref:TonB-dependent receptor n=1 Tax=Komagataeibacter xylinus NBRC 13693 TaxID=1234668 RepID=A0A0D6Q7U6_KOMXY|nr:TonB-dependent receptor [Komagataeibacter xylinus]GAN99393.1 TonB-dependent receptor [Komagataeibacter xylinus NBRC 13693]